MELKNKKINFLGDSFTFGSGAVDKSECYVSLIAGNTGPLHRSGEATTPRLMRVCKGYKRGCRVLFASRLRPLQKRKIPT